VGTAETTVRNGLASKLATPSQVVALNAVPSSFSMMYDSFTVGSSLYDTALDNIGNIAAYPSGGATLVTTPANGGPATATPTSYTTAAASTTTSTAASVQLLLSSPQMNSSGTTPLTMTAVVLDNKNQTMVGRTVSFSVTCLATTTYSCPSGAETSYISNISGTSNVSGQVTAQVNLGTNKSNRLLNVSATVDSQTSPSGSVAVTGTKISFLGNTSLALNAFSTLQLTVQDSSNTAVPGATLVVTSQNGNTLVPSSGTTNSAGQITTTVTATNACTPKITPCSGTDTLTVSGAGVSQPITLTINPASFAFTAPVAASASALPQLLVSPPLPATQITVPVSILWTVNGVAQSGVPVNFYTSRGTITGSPATTDATGTATVNISANSTGATILTASGSGGTPSATNNVVFYTTTATAISAQANPSTIAVNTVGSSSNQTPISVIVRDSNQNLVQNAHVVFNQVTDPSGGSLAANSATTDITGSTSVNYIAGTVSSQQNGVVISATVDSVNGIAISPTSSQPSANVPLTVAAQNLFVTLGTDNAIVSDSPLGTYAKNYYALVTDSAGNPAPDGTQVAFVVRPVPLAWNGNSPLYGFYKGFYVFDIVDSPNHWAQVITQSCQSEDQSFTGIYASALDLNGNNALDPDGVASVNKTATTTKGVATATITYAKSYATWVEVVLEATAGTVGNTPPATTTLILPAASSDFTTQSPPPAFRNSPYGTGNACNNTQ